MCEKLPQRELIKITKEEKEEDYNNLININQYFFCFVIL